MLGDFKNKGNIKRIGVLYHMITHSVLIAVSKNSLSVPNRFRTIAENFFLPFLFRVWRQTYAKT
jgi:hypothetical protein